MSEPGVLTDLFFGRRISLYPFQRSQMHANTYAHMLAKAKKQTKTMPLDKPGMLEKQLIMLNSRDADLYQDTCTNTAITSGIRLCRVWP